MRNAQDFLRFQSFFQHLALPLAKAKITGNKVQALNAQMQIDALRRERGALLSSLHYTLDDLQPKYSCPDCKDTGYLDGNRKCHCFEQAGISLLYEQSGH